SGRFGFLKKQTEKILRFYELDGFFQDMYFNNKNEQPHLFKNRIIQEKNIALFVDDDLTLLKFLAKENSSVLFFWLNEKNNQRLEENLIGITQLRTIMNYADK